MTFERIKKIIEKIESGNLKQMRDELGNQRTKIELELETLDNKHQKIWDDLTTLNNNDKSNDKPVEKIIGKYLNDVEKMYITIDK